MKYTIAPDIAAGKLRILAAGKTADETRVEERPLREAPFTPEFYAEIKTLLAEYIAVDPAFHASVAALVLPNEAVGVDLFRLPNVAKNKMQRAYEAELTNLYGAAAKDKKIDRFAVKKNKQYTTFGATCYEKSVAAEFYRIFTSLKILPRGTTYASAATLAAAGANSLKYHGKTFLFADVKEERTDVCLSFKGRALGVCSVPYGENLLRCGKVADEYQTTAHRSAELAVLNAKERARASSVTTFSEMEAELAPEGGDETPENLTAEEGKNATAEAAGLHFYHKNPKKLPKFLQREVPTTADGVAYENFRILQKWLLLYARKVALSEDLPAPEFILCNLPEKFYPVIERVNEEQKAEGGITFLPFTAWDKAAEEKRYPELYGAFAALKQGRTNFFQLSLPFGKSKKE